MGQSKVGMDIESLQPSMHAEQGSTVGWFAKVLVAVLEENKKWASSPWTSGCESTSVTNEL